MEVVPPTQPPCQRVQRAHSSYNTPRAERAGPRLIKSSPKASSDSPAKKSRPGQRDRPAADDGVGTADDDGAEALSRTASLVVVAVGMGPRSIKVDQDVHVQADGVAAAEAGENADEDNERP